MALTGNTTTFAEKLAHANEMYRVSGKYMPQLLAPDPSAPTPPAPAPHIDYNEAKAEYGGVIPISMGTRRMPGQFIWASAVYGTEPDLYIDLGVSFGYNGDTVPADTEITKLWANGTRIYTNGTQHLPGDWTVTLYSGTEDQLPDPMYVEAVGEANAPAYRNQLLAFISKFPLKQYDYKIPGISAEVSGTVESGGTTLFETLGTGLSVSGTNTIEMAGTSGVAHTTGQQAAALGSLSHSSGKYYLEFEITSIPPEGTLQSTSFPQFGLAMTSHDEEQPLSSGSTAFCIFRNGTFSLLGITLGSIAVGDRVGMAVDLDNHLVWARLNGGSWSGGTSPNPVTGSGGVDYQTFRPSMVGAALVPGIALWQADESATGYFAAADFDDAPPTGFSAWDEATSGGGVTATTIDAVVARIAEYAGLDPTEDLSFDPAITDEVTGCLLTEEITFEEIALRLGRAYGFDMFEADKISFVRPVNGATYTVDATIPVEDLENKGDRAITTIRGEDNSPVQLALNYIDQTQQFKYNTQRARRILFPVRTTQSRRRDGFSIPIIMTASKALTLASRAIFREADQNVTHTFCLPAEYIYIQPGDILDITAGDTSYEVKVTRVEHGPDWKVEIEAVNLFADEDIEVESESGIPLEPWLGEIAEGHEFAISITPASIPIDGAIVVPVYDPGGTQYTLSITAASIPIVGSAVALRRGRTISITAASIPIVGSIVSPVHEGGSDPNFANVVFLSHFNGVDGATSATEQTGKSLTFAGNAQLDTAQKKFGTASLLLDGTGDYVTAPDSADWDLGNTFTVECWVRFNAIADAALVSQWDSDAGVAAWAFQHIDGAGPRFSWYDTGGTFQTTTATSTWTPSTGVWYHLAADKDGSGVVRCYADGVMVAKVTGMTLALRSGSTKALSVGRLDHPTTRYVNGWIDDLRITKGVARYASDSGFTAPTAAFPDS